MTTIKEKAVDDSLALSDYLESADAVKILASRGLTTVGSLKDRTLSEIAAMPGIGERTIEQVRSLRVTQQQAKSNFGEIAENDNPIHIRSPHANYAIQVLHGDAVESGARGLRRIPPIYIMCKNGRGQLSKKEWLMRVHKRDLAAVDADMNGNAAPWRKAAAQWLRNLPKHGNEFFVMSD